MKNELELYNENRAEWIGRAAPGLAERMAAYGDGEMIAAWRAIGRDYKIAVWACLNRDQRRRLKGLCNEANQTHEEDAAETKVQATGHEADEARPAASHRA